MGADVWGANTLRNGLVGVLLIVPVFAFRHYVQDKGRFPAAQVAEYEDGGAGGFSRRAGVLPWLALLACAGVVAGAHYAAHLPGL